MQEPTPAAAAVPPWRQAHLPKPPLPTPEVYRGKQALRHCQGYHANRGGKHKAWFDAKYSGFPNYQLDPHMKNKAVPPVAKYPIAGRKPNWKPKIPFWKAQFLILQRQICKPNFLV